MKKFLSVFLTLAMLLSSFVFAAPGEVVLTESASEMAEVSAEPAESEDTAKTASDDLAFLESAQVIFSDDFESLEDGTAIIGRTPANLADGITAAYGSDAAPKSITIKTEANGNKYLNFEKNGRWDMLTINFPNDLTAVGDYYFVSSFYISDVSSKWFSVPAQLTYYTNGFTSVHNFEEFSQLDGFGWYQCVKKLTVVGQEAAEAAGVTFTDGKGDKTAPAAWIDKLYCYSTSADPANAGNMRVDNVALYFVPANEAKDQVTVSFDKNIEDEGAGVPEALTVDMYSQIVYDEYTATTTTDKEFKGWSLTPDGKVLTGKFYADKSLTLYAQWRVPQGKFEISDYTWDMGTKPSQIGDFGANAGSVSVTYGDDGSGTTAMKITQGTPSTTFSSQLTLDNESEAKQVFASHDPNANCSGFAFPAKQISAVDVRYKFVTPYKERKTGSNNFQMFFMGTTTSISEGSTFVANVVPDGEWHTFTFDTSKYAGWKDIINRFRLDTINDYYAGEELYIDYIKFYTLYEIPDVETPATFTPATGSTGLDYRDSTIRISFGSRLDAFADQIAAAYGSDFTGGTFDPDTNSYTMYYSAPDTLTNKTVTTGSGIVFGNEQNYRIPGFTLSYADGTMASDGKNLLPNGDFSQRWVYMLNKDANWVKNVYNGILTTGKSVASSNNYNSMSFVNLPLTKSATTTEPKRYYLEYKARMNPAMYTEYTALNSSNIYDENGNPVTDKGFLAPKINIYAPQLSGSTASTVPKYFEYPSYISGISPNVAAAFTNGNWITRAGVYKVYSDSSSNIYFQNVIEGYTNKFLDAEHTIPVGYSTGGFYLDYDYISLREMYKVNFLGGEGATGTGPADERYYAEGLTITLPTDIGFENAGKGFSGWEYEGNIYLPGDAITINAIGDVNLTATWSQGVIYKYGETEVAVTDITYPYTLPATVEGISYTGANAENYVLDYWAFGKLKYPAGTIFTEENSGNIEGKTFVAVFADKTVPAMGYSLEGDKLDGFSYQKMNPVETVFDNGFTALHSTWDYTNTWDNNAKKYLDDPRIQLSLAEKSTTEYNVFKIRYKLQNTNNYTDTDGTHVETDPAITSGGSRMYMSGTRGIYSESQRFDVGESTGVTANGEYFVFTRNLLNMTNGTDGFLAQGGVKTMWIDPIQTHKGEIFVDYVRLYRGGAHTVKYNTNAPAGTTEVTATPSDTGVGLGTGYMLSGEEPTVSDAQYMFAGWALTPDAALDDIVKTVDLEADLEVYAVWIVADAPTASTAAEIRVPDDKVIQGLRFASAVTEDQRTLADEYGYIIALTDTLNGEELTFDFTGKYVYGAAYSTDTGIDKIYAYDGTDVIFTGVLTNIPADKYQVSITARPYLKINCGTRVVTLYGTAVSATPYDTANDMLTQYDNGLLELTDAQVEFLLAMTE